jgi:hypothetical protein
MHCNQLPMREFRVRERAVSIADLISAPTAVFAGVLGAWRLGADLGWTSSFIIGKGLLSHHQFWFALAIAVPWFGSILKQQRTGSGHTPRPTRIPEP